MPAPPNHLPAHWRGPLRLAVAILLAGVLVVWLVKPIGDACPDLDVLPAGSTASSSPSFSPPLTRTCTYLAAGGTQATAGYVPWLDWLVLLLVAAAVGGVAGLLGPGARAGDVGRPRPERMPGKPAEPAGRDADERERARRERAQRNRSDR